MKDSAIFLLKVVALSTGVSVLIKVGGPRLSFASVEGPQLNHLAIALVTLPSVIVGTILLIQRRS